MELTKWPLHAVRREAKSGALKSRPTKERAANGRPVLEYSSLSLPADLQIELERTQLAAPSVDRSDPKPSGAQLISFRQPPAAAVPRIVVTGTQRERASHLLEIIRPLIEFSKLSPGGEQRLWCAQNDRDVANLSHLVEQIAKETGKPSTTIWGWYGRFKRGGINELARRVRADKGVSRWFKQHHKAAILAAYL